MRKPFSFPVFLGALLVAGVFLSVRLNLGELQTLPDGSYHVSIFEGDTWYHILEGEQILRTHTWPTKDVYSFTAHGNNAMAFEWLGQIAFALVDRWGGVRALAGVLVALAATLLVLLYVYAYLRCSDAKAAFLACIALLPLATAFFTLRPQLIGYLFLLITMICLERYRQGHPKAIWCLPVLFLVWVNTHGSFVLGFVVLAIYWASGLTRFRCGSVAAAPWTDVQRRNLSVIILLCVLALAVTPYGTAVAGFTLHVILNAPLGMTHITEYQPLAAFGGLLTGFLLVLGLFAVGLVVTQGQAKSLSHHPYRLEEVALLLLAMGGALVHARLLLFFVLVFAPLFAVMLSHWTKERDLAPDHYLLNAALMVLICAAIVRFFPSAQQLENVIARGFPAGAVEYLREHPVPGPMFNEDLWGAYLIRSLGPDQRVFIDGRSQLYEESGVFADYLRIMQVDRQTSFLLNKYGVTACLIQYDSPLATLLAILPGWRREYSDSLSSLFVHEDLPSPSLHASRIKGDTHNAH